jgi:hypothetical protein
MPGPAAATPTFQSAFAARYPTSTLLTRMQTQTGSSCNLCHMPSSTSAVGNCYRAALIVQRNNGLTQAQAIVAVEGMDSDGDGVSNLAEILAPRTATPITNQPETPPSCYANCDGSTTPPVLNVNDFTCFLNLYAAGDSRANCDGSTTAPVLNVNDFTCFLNRYAAGCP